ncbi:MAG: hypothetical protein JWP52_3963 [Rhizobacter sp.]|jgi:hypothetical protein|nr:hypothetical protein [Rhizobacter sp.]
MEMNVLHLFLALCAVLLPLVFVWVLLTLHEWRALLALQAWQRDRYDG